MSPLSTDDGGAKGRPSSAMPYGASTESKTRQVAVNWIGLEFDQPSGGIGRVAG